MNLAKLYGLDADEVYKARWFKGAANKHNVGDNLPKITDRAWVLHQCLTRLADTHEAQRAVLTYGLKETAAGVPAELRLQPTAEGDDLDHHAAHIVAPPLLGVRTGARTWRCACCAWRCARTLLARAPARRRSRQSGPRPPRFASLSPGRCARSSASA